MKSSALNFFILAAPKSLKALSVFVVDVLVARYMGVEAFGQLAFITSLFLILAVFPKFGLENVIVKDRVNGELDKQAFDHARSGDVMAQLAAKSDATNLRALLNEEGLGGFSVFEIQSGTDREPRTVSELSETMEDS